MNNDSESMPGPPARSARGCLISLAVLLALLFLGGYLAFKQFTKPVDGVRLVYDIENAQPQADQMAVGLQRRFDRLTDAKTIVRPMPDGISVEILIPSRDAAVIANVKRIAVLPGSMRFLIVANQADHGGLIKTAIAAADKSLRDVKDDNGIVIGRWVTAYRSASVGSAANASGVISDSSSAGVQLGVNLAALTTRDEATGNALPTGMPGGQEDQTQWLMTSGITAVQVLMEVDSELAVNGDDLSYCESTTDSAGSAAIAFKLTDKASTRFHALTKANLPAGNGFQRQLGIVINDVLVTAPNILAPINGQGQITGNFTQQEMEETVQLLRTGRLPVNLVPQPKTETQTKVPFRF